MLNSSNCRLGDVIFTACLDMHAETKAELLALKSEMKVRESKTQAEILALKSETQTLKIEMRQMEASMASKFASIEKALMHGKNKTSSVNGKAWFVPVLW